MSNILVVDDESAVLKFTVCVLERAGHRVMCASSGLEALMLFESYATQVDLVITDVLMPEMSGLELVARIRATHPSTRVLLMSGFVPEEWSVPERHALLSKPFRPDELVVAVQKALQQA